jgi:hypothetical protein
MSELPNARETAIKIVTEMLQEIEVKQVAKVRRIMIPVIENGLHRAYREGYAMKLQTNEHRRIAFLFTDFVRTLNSAVPPNHIS